MAGIWTNTLPGTELHPDDRRHVLAAYVHRYTGDHKPAWTSKEWKPGIPYPLQFRNDADWLKHTRFVVRKDGRLDRRTKYCQSSPTWPNGRPTQEPTL